MFILYVSVCGYPKLYNLAETLLKLNNKSDYEFNVSRERTYYKLNDYSQLV